VTAGVGLIDERARPLEIPRNVVETVVLGIATAVVFFGGWSIVSWAFGPALFPGPASVLEAIGTLAANGTLLASVGVSLSRIAVGYVLGLVVGLVAGVVLAQVRLLDRVLMPIISLARMIPPTAIIPLAIIWFGIGESSKYFIVFWGCVLVVFLNTYDGISRVPKTRIWAAQCLGAGPARIVREVILPSTIPFAWTGARAALGLAFMSVVAAEMIAAQSGLGYMIMQSRVLMQTDRMFVGLLALPPTGLLVDALFTRIGRRALNRYLDFYQQS
jgi:ABC-type nitrate/sulfonate/bicarbonate transport system permease component